MRDKVKTKAISVSVENFSMLILSPIYTNFESIYYIISICPINIWSSKIHFVTNESIIKLFC